MFRTRRLSLFGSTATLFACATALLLGLSAHAWHDENWLRASSLKLKEGMTIGDVDVALGSPDKVESTTCGTETKAPWRCRNWFYISQYGAQLLIRFQLCGKTWCVNSWSFWGI